jgi:hypothetical protein
MQMQAEWKMQRKHFSRQEAPMRGRHPLAAPIKTSPEGLDFNAANVR